MKTSDKIILWAGGTFVVLAVLTLGAMMNGIFPFDTLTKQGNSEAGLITNIEKME